MTRTIQLRSDDTEEGIAHEMLACVRAACGPETAAAFARLVAGRRVYIPAGRPTPDGELSRTLGHEGACAVVAAIGLTSGLSLTFPAGEHSAWNTAKLSLRERVREGALAGKSVNDLAHELGVTTRTIHYHRARMRAAGLLPPRDG